MDYEDDGRPVPVELLSIDFTSERGIEDFAVHVMLTRTEARKHLDRARGILRDHLIRVVSDDGQHVQGRASGSQGETYAVGAMLQGEEWADLSCSCPQGGKNGGMCKHSLALLLARVQPGYKLGGSDAAPLAASCAPAQAPTPQPSALPPPQQVPVSAQPAGRRRLPPALLQQTQQAAAKKVKREQAAGRAKQEPAAKELAPRRKRAAPPSAAGAHKSSTLQGIPYEALPKRHMTATEMAAVTDEELLEMCRRKLAEEEERRERERKNQWREQQPAERLAVKEQPCQQQQQPPPAAAADGPNAPAPPAALPLATALEAPQVAAPAAVAPAPTSAPVPSLFDLFGLGADLDLPLPAPAPAVVPPPAAPDRQQQQQQQPQSSDHGGNALCATQPSSLGEAGPGSLQAHVADPSHGSQGLAQANGAPKRSLRERMASLRGGQ